MSLEVRLLAVAAICLVAFLALGYAVTHPAGLWRLDAQAAGVRGQLVPLAIAFTTSGRAVPLLIVAIAGTVAVVLARWNAIVPIAIFIAQLLSQGAVELVKHVFHRARPDAWLVREELGFSYPSGHATTAVVFFGSWIVVVLLSPLPKPAKILLAAVIAVWAIGIDWSRLALNAHYLTDVAGGTLFGVASACVLWAILLHFRIGVPS